MIYVCVLLNELSNIKNDSKNWSFTLAEQQFSLIMTDYRFYFTCCPNLTDFGIYFKLNT